MSAELLRRAASLMRERAQAYVPTGRIEVTESANVAHVRSWQPAVALAVADVLDNAVEDIELRGPGGDLPFDYSVGLSVRKALAVARAYLGQSS